MRRDSSSLKDAAVCKRMSINCRYLRCEIKPRFSCMLGERSLEQDLTSTFLDTLTAAELICPDTKDDFDVVANHKTRTPINYIHFKMF